MLGSGTEKLPESPDSTMTDSIPPDTLADYLPDPIPPDTLVDHLPNPIPPDTLPDILLDPIPPDILLDAQADSIAPAPQWGERRGDGDYYAPVPYVDPGGQQPEVIGALCGHGLNVRILAQTFLTALIGGDTALTVDVSDLPQKTEGKVNMRTKHLRGRFKKPVFYLV